MNVLLVEDNIVQANEIIKKIKVILDNDVEISGPFSDLNKILPHIQSGSANLALIDIQLNKDLYAGISIAETIQSFSSIPIIFMSEITNREVIERTDGIKYCDFLKKPFDDDSLGRAVLRAIKAFKFQNNNNLRVAFKPLQKDKYWIKSDRAVYSAVDPEDIICVEALDHHCRFYVKGMSPITTKAKLRSEVFENGLSNYNIFFQLSRSIVLNLHHIDRIDGNEIIIKEFKLMNKKALTISKQNKKLLFDALGIRSRSSKD